MVDIVDIALCICKLLLYNNFKRGGNVTSQFQCNVMGTFRSNLYFTSVYLIASCYRAIIGIVGLLDVRCKVLFWMWFLLFWFVVECGSDNVL